MTVWEALPTYAGAQIPAVVACSLRKEIFYYLHPAASAYAGNKFMSRAASLCRVTEGKGRFAGEVAVSVDKSIRKGREGVKVRERRNDKNAWGRSC